MESLSFRPKRPNDQFPKRPNDQKESIVPISRVLCRPEPASAIYLLRTSPCASSVLPSIAAEAFGRATLDVDGLHELAASSGNSTTVTRRLVVSYTRLLTLAPSLAKRGGAVVFFSPDQPSPTASTFRSGVPCAARTFLSPLLSEAPAADQSSAFGLQRYEKVWKEKALK